MRFIALFKGVVLVPLAKLFLLLKQGIYTWLAIMFYVGYMHRDAVSELFRTPSLSSFWSFLMELSGTLQGFDQQIYDITRDMMGAEASFSGVYLMASSFFSIAGVLLTILLFVKALDVGMRSTFFKGAPKLATWGLSIVIWLLVAAQSQDVPFEGVRLFLDNFTSFVDVFGEWYDSLPLTGGEDVNGSNSSFPE